MASAAELKHNAALYCLALGAFAIGTEGFMLAGLLPIIANDLSVSLAAAGQLVTVFSLAYAISSPILTTLSAGVNRRRFLIIALLCFTAANFAACASPGYLSLLATRVLLAVSAGLYMPSANALASSLVAPERRGRALATVHGGITIAVALGVPLGAWIGERFGWRATFAGIGVLSAIVTLGVVLGLPRTIGANTAVPSLAQRVAVARQPAVLVTLLITALWAAGIWIIYPYLAPFLTGQPGFGVAQVGAVLLLYGVFAGIGVFISGRAIDRFGSRKVLIVCLVAMMLSYESLSFSAQHLEPVYARIAILVAIAVWGAAGWAFNPAQQAKLIAIGGMDVAPVSLSLNSSFTYLGFAFGAAIGSFIVAYRSVSDIGMIGGLCELAALVVALATDRYMKRVARQRAMQPHEKETA
ncbi:MFS transporter [Burkholderia sp. MSh2]|uniref:Major facilitator superfamily protein n=1 Tax=Burkholderia paludis TaxID=1506587 RepID=A0A6J5DII2_9BURK|nr:MULTISPECIES: MFS transporter [Burkholderia]KEZ04070.1 MFS transporter [Burkholderia sp. MSh2]KFG98096.1 MFS transporter [Burkholderia paludis]CAB3753012.1 Purine efflux pump PbuE [Burkholderia paludis]VWB64841.1 major facilitator superfamily protein [Burkholderia paludis]